MKIVFLAPFGIRPKGTVIARMLPLAVELQKRGHTVTIIAPPYTNPEDSGKREIVHGVRLVNVVLPPGGKACRALPLAWRMFRAARAEQPDLVHLFKPKGYGGLAAMLHIALQRLNGTLAPLFLDTDDWEGKGGMNDLLPYSPREKQLYAFQERWLSRHAAGVTVASRALEELTGNLGVPPQRIHYLPNCVEAAPPGNGGRVREKLGIAADVPLVLLYTRFFEFGQERLYRLFADIHRKVPNARFLVMGRGRNREEERLVTASGEFGFRDSLVMAGWIEPQDIPDYLAAGDMALYPLDDTLVNRAKCPAKLTELLQAGLPVVADAIGQAREYIDPASGMLCMSNDAAEMATIAAELLLNPEQRMARGGAARSFILAHFGWSSSAAGLERFYDRLTAEQKRLHNSGRS